MRKLTAFLTLAFTLLIVASCNDDKEGSSLSNPMKASVAIGVYSGDFYGNNTGVFLLGLIKGEIDEEAGMTGAGSGLILQLYSDIASDPDNASLAVGIYIIASTGARLTIAPGELDIDGFYGSIHLVKDKNGKEEMSEIIAGSIKVERSGVMYTITTDLKTKSGKSLFYIYKGEIQFENELLFFTPKRVIDF